MKNEKPHPDPLQWEREKNLNFELLNSALLARLILNFEF